MGKVTITTSATGITFNSRSTFYDATTGLIDSLYIGSSANRLSFAYDSLGRLATVRYPGGVIRTDSYYSSGQLANTEWSGGVSIYRGYGYDSTGHVNEIDYTGLLKGDSLALYTYDVLGELAGRQLAVWTDNLTTCPGGQLQNGFGCRAGSSRSDSVIQSVSYFYDAAGNLDTVKVGSTDSVATLQAGNRLTAWTGRTFAIDSDGNRTSTTVGSQTTTYTWGADGRLLSVTQGGTTRSYDYDPSGQLVQRKTNGTVDRYYLWDNGHILAILNGSTSSRVAEFVYFGGADQPLARITGPSTSDTIHYYAQDGSGNVIAQFYGTTIEQNLAYDPWGAATVISPHGDTTQLRWKGLLYEDGVTSLYYMRARWYDPTTRRFVSSDPLGIVAGVNQFAYAGGDPVSGSDASGLRGCNLQYEEQINVGGDQWCQVLSYVWVNSAPLIPFDGTTSGITEFGPSPLDVPGGSSGNGQSPSNPVPTNPCTEAANAPGPNWYANQGRLMSQQAATITVDPMVNYLSADTYLLQLSQFRRNGALDAQPFGASRAYANYVYGAAMAASGWTLLNVLSGANNYAQLSHAQYTRNDGPIDTQYTSIPTANVQNITNGYNAYKNGTLCHK